MDQKILGGLVVGLLILVISSLFILEKDEPLKPELVSLMALFQPPKQSHAYFYWLGFDAPAGQDPLQAGKARFLEGSQQHFSIATTEAGDRLPIPDKPLACGIWTDDCPDKPAGSGTRQEHIHKHQELLNRYKTFLWLDDFYGMEASLFSLPGPNALEYLMAANQLFVIETILEAQSTSHDEAIDKLIKNINQLRSKMENVNDIYFKSVYATLLKNNIYVMADLSHASGVRSEQTIAELSPTEMDIKQAIARNLVGWQDHMALIDSNLVEQGIAFRRIIFKPQKTLNQMYPVINHQLEFSQLSPEEFFNRSDSARHHAPSKTRFDIFNLVGSKESENVVFTLNNWMVIDYLFSLTDTILLYNTAMTQHHPHRFEEFSALAKQRNAILHRDDSEKTLCLERNYVTVECLSYTF